ncbi:hypothetical protein STUTZSP0542_32010 [Stutzerimonas marianensis]
MALAPNRAVLIASAVIVAFIVASWWVDQSFGLLISDSGAWGLFGGRAWWRASLGVFALGAAPPDALAALL